ncbi:sigma-54-dependent Fis family transcriptional regulator [Rhizobacter sp. P5_C2]
MKEAQALSLRIEHARDLFFMQGRDLSDAEGLAPHISRSWRRCRSVDQAAVEPEPVLLQHLRERREQSMQMLACAQPELDGLTEHALSAGCVVILTDPSGLILEEIGSPEFLPKAQRIALAPGVEWSETSRGTNAIGTALLERQSLMVLGGEHFLPQNGAIGCAASPIFTGRGEIAGVIDISGEAAQVNDHTLGLVRMAAQQVEHRLMLAQASGHLLRFHAKPGLLGTAREGLVVIDDGRIVAANRVALGLLGTAWGGLLDQSVEALIGMRWSQLESRAGLLTLPDGRQIAATVERTARGATWRAPSRPPATRVAEVHPAMDDVAPLLKLACKVLDGGLPILVTGETGSGKEVFARALHHASRRSKGPFVAVNCAALPETLIEAELFGYEAGAFTGARRRGMPGRIREASGGVLFLDEIGDMPLLLQTRLLRVLEERTVVPLGGGPGIRVDFDLVCATHRDLQQMSAVGAFRADLLYRVDGYRVAVPPLRRRRDRRALIERLFGQLAQAKRLSIDRAALDRLDAHAWAGNVRELNSMLRAMVALADEGDTLGVDQLPDRFVATTAQDPQHRLVEVEPALSDVVENTIDQVLSACHGNVATAAKRLGVHRSTVYRHLAQRSTSR